MNAQRRSAAGVMARRNSEIAALESAKQEVEWHKANEIDFLGVRVRFLGPDSGRALAAHAVASGMQKGRIDPGHALQRAQEGDPLFDEAFRLLAAAQMSGVHPLRGVAGLHEAVIQALSIRPKVNRARRRETNYLRDVCMTMIVQRVHEEFGLTVYGSSAKRLSACGVVAIAMGMEYDTVRKAVRYFIKEI